jgi:hypothetical protein
MASCPAFYSEIAGIQQAVSWVGKALEDARTENGLKNEIELRHSGHNGITGAPLSVFAD